MKQFQCTEQELEKLAELIHAGNLHPTLGGLNNANAAAVWQQKINNAEDVVENITNIDEAKEA